MTTYNKTSLKTFFETNDVPSGTDYANLIDSQVNLVETTEQAMAGPLYATEVRTARASGAACFFTTVSATNLYASSVGFGSLSISGTLNGNIYIGTSARFTYASATNFKTSNFYTTVGIVSATGTTQATAATATYSITRLQGVTDGSATGLILQSNKAGLTQTVINETAVSANLYPCTGGTINNGSANAPMALAANTSYRVIHAQASAYWVK